MVHLQRVGLQTATFMMVTKKNCSLADMSTENRSRKNKNKVYHIMKWMEAAMLSKKSRWIFFFNEGKVHMLM